MPVVPSVDDLLRLTARRVIDSFSFGADRRGHMLVVRFRLTNRREEALILGAPVACHLGRLAIDATAVHGFRPRTTQAGPALQPDDWSGRRTRVPIGLQIEVLTDALLLVFRLPEEKLRYFQVPAPVVAEMAAELGHAMRTGVLKDLSADPPAGSAPN